jgi:hypothetical protein
MCVRPAQEAADVGSALASDRDTAETPEPMTDTACYQSCAWTYFPGQCAYKTLGRSLEGRPVF